MNAANFYEEELGKDTCEFYRSVMQHLSQSKIPFLVGGAFGFWHYTGIVRPTKDIDLFLKPEDVHPALKVMREAGYETELTDSVWLAKARSSHRFVDFIFRAGNSLAQVDDHWFTYAPPQTILGVPVKICPAEETIWSKAFTMERDRYDGHDIAHLFLRCGTHLNWARLLARFGEQWRVLLSHLILFGFIYPSEQTLIPKVVMNDLWNRLAKEANECRNTPRLCKGTYLSRTQYAVDVEAWNFTDARLASGFPVTAQEEANWRKIMAKEKHQLSVA